MKETEKTQGRPRKPGIRRYRATGGAGRLLFTFLFPLLAPGGARAASLTPDAEAVLDRLDARIAAAEASQAARDLFLESLRPGAACGDWAADPRFRRDPDLAVALEEACPDAFPSPPVRKPRRRTASGDARGGAEAAPRLRVTPRLRMAQDVRPRGEGPTPTAMEGALEGPRFAVEAAASDGRLRTRGLSLDGEAWSARAGRLDPAGSGLPHLDFVSGRGRFAGWSGRSGVAGPLEAHDAALDGAALRIGRDLRAGAFGAWNRLHPASGEDGIRRDASALSLSLGASGREGGEWALQVLHQRLEVSAPPGSTAPLAAGAPPTSGAGPAAAGTVLGAGFSLPGGTGAGAAASLLTAGPAGRPRPGAYAEASLEGRKPGRYLFRARQASPGWAGALSGTPAYLRDTVAGGLILPGRGEGGLEARSRLPLAGRDEPAKGREAARAWLEAAGGAAWALGGAVADPPGAADLPLADAPPWLSERPSERPEDAGSPGLQLIAGEGRASLHLARPGWQGAGHAALRWRASGRTATGLSRTYGVSAGCAGKSWRLRASLARSSAATAGPAWPAALETAWRAPSGHSAAAGIALGDAARPGSKVRLTMRQTWRLGGGAAISQALRLPWRAGKLGEEMGLHLRLDWDPGGD